MATAAYNTPPDGWREITEAQFAKSGFFSEQWTESHRQFPIEWQGRSVYHGVLLFTFFTGDGVALTNEFWDGKVRYFAFGCDHAWRDDGRFVTCTKCSFSHPRRDSSD